MRNLIIMLGCTLLASAAVAGGNLQRYNFHFAKPDAGAFEQDRDACIRETSTRGQDAKRPGVQTMGERGNTSYRHNPAAFYQCMLAKGYQPDPNGPLKATLWISH